MRRPSSRLFSIRRAARTQCVQIQSIERALPSLSGNGGLQIGGIEREAQCSEELRVPAQ
jgi:hypothetical protein